MGQPRGPQRLSTSRNNTQRGATDDIFVTAKGQSQRKIGWSGSNGG